MHELRRGELAGLRAIPHTPYFGSVDATPLWLLLVAELTMWTGDLDGFDFRRDAVDAALALARRRTATSTATASWSTSAARESGCATRAGGTRATPSCTATAASPSGRSPWPRRRATCTTPSDASPSIYGQLGDVERAERLTQRGRRAQAALQRALLDGGRGLLRDGARRREAAGADGVLDRSVTPCGRASSPTSTSRPWSSASWRPTCSPAGASARSARRCAATTR